MPDSLHEPPHAAALLAIAADTLHALILPALPPDRRGAALMVLRAMAIAAREIRADPVAGLPDGLAAEIRAGRHDPGTADWQDVAARLADLAAARCAVSNPKALQRD